MKATFLTISAFLRARYLMRRLSTRAALEAFQVNRIAHFLSQSVPRVPAFAGAHFARLGDAPLLDKATMMAGFEHYNRICLTAEEGWDIFESRAPQRRGYSVGASTGTSGNRGLYVISERERFLWLGVMLSRALPNILVRSERVAVMLPQASRLYDAANESRRLVLQFFDLAGGVERLFRPVSAFAPTVVVAPPRVLRALAEADVDLSPRHVFSGGEVLDDIDRALIEARFQCRVRQIYMATEGLFAVSCIEGGLHLIEDHIAFETLTVPGSTKHVNPVITDFSRGTQIMLRYQMNDIVSFGTQTCPCGSVHRTLASIAGRLDDTLRLAGVDGAHILMTPDVVRNAVVDSHRGIDDFRVIQIANDRVVLRLKSDQAGLLEGARLALQNLFSTAGANVSVSGEAFMPIDSSGRKLRRVEVAIGRDKA